MIKKDFKQKYFLYCKDCKVDEITPKKVVYIERKDYLCRIEIKEI